MRTNTATLLFLATTILVLCPFALGTTPNYCTTPNTTNTDYCNACASNTTAWNSSGITNGSGYNICLNGCSEIDTTNSTTYAKGCKTCQAGWTLYNWTNYYGCFMIGCQTYHTTIAVQCQTCFDGNYGVPSAGPYTSCPFCSDNCSTCAVSAGNCTACETNYLTYPTNATGTNITGCISNCQTASSATACSACNTGTTLNNGLCLPNNCKTGNSSNPGKCKFCNSGYYGYPETAILSYDSCKNCSTNCTKCATSKICIDCSSGYRPNLTYNDGYTVNVSGLTAKYTADGATAISYLQSSPDTYLTCNPSSNGIITQAGFIFMFALISILFMNA